MAPPSTTVIRPKRTYFDPQLNLVEVHDDVYIKQLAQSRCGICGKNTKFKSRYALEHICSVECSNELWCQITEKIASTSALKKRK